MTPTIPWLPLLLPIQVRDPFPVTPGHPALVTFLLIPTRVRDPFLVIRGLLAPVTITTLLLIIIRVRLLDLVFSAGDEPPRDSSFKEDMMWTFFTDYPSYLHHILLLEGIESCALSLSLSPRFWSLLPKRGRKFKIYGQVDFILVLVL
jgi:hypothetical protein